MNKLVQEVYYSDSLVEKESHFHDCHQMILVLRGAADFCVNNATCRAESGSIVLFSRHESHSVNVLTDVYERFVLHIGPDAGYIEPAVYPLLFNRPAGFRNVIDVSAALSELQLLFSLLIREHTTRGKLTGDMQKLLINTLLVTVYRQLPDTACFEDHGSTVVYSIQRQFEADCGQQYDLKALAKAYNISPSSLSHQFKQITGSSVMGYLLSCRITSAKHYLTHSDLSIGQIVETCGFSDNSNFSRTFKKLTGCSPSAFRRKYQHPKD